MAGQPIKRARMAEAAAKGEEYHDCTTKKERAKKYHKITAEEIKAIAVMIREFVPLYNIAVKIGCGYSTILKLVKEHPLLSLCKREADEAQNDIVKTNLFHLTATEVNAAKFWLSARCGWKEATQQELTMNIPQVQMGDIPKEVMASLPAGLGQPEQAKDTGANALPPPVDTKLTPDEEFGEVAKGAKDAPDKPKGGGVRGATGADEMDDWDTDGAPDEDGAVDMFGFSI